MSRTARCAWALGWLFPHALKKALCDPGLADEAVQPLAPRVMKAASAGLTMAGTEWV